MHKRYLHNSCLLITYASRTCLRMLYYWCVCSVTLLFERTEMKCISTEIKQQQQQLFCCSDVQTCYREWHTNTPGKSEAFRHRYRLYRGSVLWLPVRRGNRIHVHCGRLSAERQHAREPLHALRPRAHTSLDGGRPAGVRDPSNASHGVPTPVQPEFPP